MKRKKLIEFIKQLNACLDTTESVEAVGKMGESVKASLNEDERNGATIALTGIKLLLKGELPPDITPQILAGHLILTISEYKKGLKERQDDGEEV